MQVAEAEAYQNDLSNWLTNADVSTLLMPIVLFLEDFQLMRGYQPQENLSKK